jgi:hypothetical protein
MQIRCSESALVAAAAAGPYDRRQPSASRAATPRSVSGQPPGKACVISKIASRPRAHASVRPCRSSPSTAGNRNDEIPSDDCYCGRYRAGDFGRAGRQSTDQRRQTGGRPGLRDRGLHRPVPSRTRATALPARLSSSEPWVQAVCPLLVCPPSAAQRPPPASPASAPASSWVTCPHSRRAAADDALRSAASRVPNQPWVAAKAALSVLLGRITASIFATSGM